jgi:hypothetical protein
MKTKFNSLVSLKNVVLMFVFLASFKTSISQDLIAGSFNNRVYENKILGFMIKNIPEQWQCSMTPKRSLAESKGFPIFETLGDSLQILIELADTTRISVNIPLRIYLLVEPISFYESKCVHTAEQFFSFNKARVIEKATTGSLRFTFNEVRSTNNVGGEEFKYQGNTIILKENWSRNQMAFCSIREGYYFIILLDGFEHDQDLLEATNLLKRFWWTK